MHRPLLSSIVPLLLVAPILAQKEHALPGLGIAFEAPKGWVELPAAGHRGQLAAMYCAEKAITSRGGEVASHPPTLRVLLLRESEDSGPREVEGLPRRTPFADFDDYLARGRRPEARVQIEDTEAVDGMPVRRFVAEGADPNGHRTAYGAVLTTGAGEVVVEFEVLSDHLAKHEKEFERCLQSISGIGVEGDAHPPRAPWVEDEAAWQQKDDAAKADLRREWAEAVVARAEEPERGWKEYPSRHWTVLSAADAGFTKKAIQAAEAMREFAAARFGAVSEREPLPAVLRIFGSPEHYRVFTEREPVAREYDRDRRELYFFEDPDAGSTDGFGMLLRAVLWQYLDDEQPGVSTYLPRWLDEGLWQYCESSQVRGKKIEFEADEVEDGRIRYQLRADGMPAVWNLIQESQQPSPEDGAEEEPWGYRPECARLVRWLLDHDGGEAFDRPELLVDYVRALGAARADWGPDPVADVERAKLEDEQAKAMRQKYYTWRDGLLRGTNDRAVPFEVDVWQAINEKWLAFARAST